MKRVAVKQEKNIENVIAELGLRKDYVAEQAKITPVELSHIIAGRRKTNAYVKKEKQVKQFLLEAGGVF